MFLDLLCIMAGVAGCSGVVLSGHSSGLAGVLILWAGGLGVGFACFVVMRAVVKWGLTILDGIAHKYKYWQMILGWVLFFVAIILVGVSALIGNWITKSVVQLFP